MKYGIVVQFQLTSIDCKGNPHVLLVGQAIPLLLIEAVALDRTHTSSKCRY